MSEQFAEYRRKLAGRRSANLREFEREKSIRSNYESSFVGVLIAWLTGGLVTGSFLSGGAIFAGILGAVGGWLWVHLRALIRFWRRAPYELDEERGKELAAAQATIAAINRSHAEELESLRHQLAAALKDHVTQAYGLTVTAYTDHLSHLYNSTHELLTSVFTKREFALLSVRNSSTTNLSQIVARCRFDESVEDYCIWARGTGSPPFEPGTHEADLSAGNSRLLVIARGFGDEELWARLPPQGEPLHLLSRAHVVSINEGVIEDEIMLVSHSGSLRTLPREIPVTVTFQAAGFYQEERFVLSFAEDGKPTITPATGERHATVR